MIGILIARHILFVAFFVLIGAWWVSVLPVLGGVFLLLYSSSESTYSLTREGTNAFLKEHALSLSWIMVMIGLRGFLDIVTGASLQVVLWLMLCNLILWIGSYVTKYHDGKVIFHLGRYIASALFLVSTVGEYGFGVLFDLLVGWTSVTMAVYAFLVFVLGAVWMANDKSLHYPLFILFNCCIVYLIAHYTQGNGGFSLMAAQAYLMILYAGIWWIYNKYGTANPLLDESEDALFEHIMDGKLISRYSKPQVDSTIELVDDAYTFLGGINETGKQLMGLINVGLMIAQIALFIIRMQSWLIGLDSVWFRWGVGFFFGSFLLLRSIGFAYKIQRVMAFILLNFGIYLSIIARFGNDVVYIVGLGIIWTIVNSLAVFQLRFLDPRGVLTSEDVMYWIIGTGLATLCNIYFMFLLPVSYQLIFSMVFLYVGIQVFLMRYNVASLEE